MTDEVTVTQADREAAAKVESQKPIKEMIVNGRYDGHPLAQAFARHRLASQQAVPNSVVEELSWWRVNASTSRADAIGLRFYVYHNKAGYWSAYTEGFQTWNQECDSEEEAKRAAQAEFERRIYSTLQGQTAPAGDVVESQPLGLLDDGMCDDHGRFGCKKCVAALTAAKSQDAELLRKFAPLRAHAERVEQEFLEKQGDRERPIWLSVNVLQSFVQFVRLWDVWHEFDTRLSGETK